MLYVKVVGAKSPAPYGYRRSSDDVYTLHHLPCAATRVILRQAKRSLHYTVAAAAVRLTGAGV